MTYEIHMYLQIRKYVEEGCRNAATMSSVAKVAEKDPTIHKTRLKRRAQRPQHRSRVVEEHSLQGSNHGDYHTNRNGDNVGRQQNSRSPLLESRPNPCTVTRSSLHLLTGAIAFLRELVDVDNHYPRVLHCRACRLRVRTSIVAAVPPFFCS